MTTNDTANDTPGDKTSGAAPASGPDYDRLAAELMQQWQQQFLKPVLKPELADAMGQSGAVAQNLMEMGQVLWQSWLHPQAGNDTDMPAAPDPKSAYAAQNAAADLSNTLKHDAAAAAAPVHEPGSTAPPRAETSVQPDAPFTASMAGVALCAELARRLDLLSQRVTWLERQLEQQRANK